MVLEPICRSCCDHIVQLQVGDEYVDGVVALLGITMMCVDSGVMICIGVLMTCVGFVMICGIFSDPSELSKDELMKIVEHQSAELDVRTQKKEIYKTKYLEEKQRAATMSDYYKGEIERYTREIELIRSTLDVRLKLHSNIS